MHNYPIAQAYMYIQLHWDRIWTSVCTGVDRCKSDRRGADLPWEGCIGMLTSRF